MSIASNLHDLISITFKTIFAMFLLSLFLVFGSRLEAQLFPVSSVMVNSTYWYDDEYVLNGVFWKARDCEFLGAVFIDRFTKKQYKVTYPKDTSEADASVSRPTGEYQFFDWVMSNPREGATVDIYSNHRCHPLWATLSHSGTFRINHK